MNERLRISQLNHVALHVADLEASGRFYRQVLGLEPLDRPAFDFPGAWFRLGEDQELHLIGGRNRPAHSHNRGTHFALCVPSIDEARACLDRYDIQYAGPHRRPDGAWQIFLIDPDGHYVELCELPE